MPADIETLSIDTIRCLAMDAVQKANAGHPGTAMALAPVAYVLFRERMRHDPADPPGPTATASCSRPGTPASCSTPRCTSRATTSRSTTSSSSGSGARARPGTPSSSADHPIPGIEITTGPLGQGVGNAVGMALAEAMLAERYNGDGEPLVDHRTYAICSDGDVMEGVSGEASSLAGFLGLGKLCLIYDDNHITIEGSTGLAFGEDVGLRYEAYGFHVQRLDDGWTTDDLRAAFDAADAETERPSLIIVRTHIAIGAPHAQDTPEAHGAPLGEEEVRLTKQAYGWDPDKHLLRAGRGLRPLLPARARRRRPRRLGRAARGAAGAPTRRASSEFDRVLSGDAARRAGRTRCPTSRARDPAGHARQLGRLHRGAGRRDPRVHRRLGRPRAVEQLHDQGRRPRSRAHRWPTRRTRSADSVLPGRMGGRTLHFGIREHGMGAILNGLTVHGGFRAFGATFFVFSDYMRPAVRLACIMGLPVIYVWTHDSIGLGEDGPTHQPIEHLASLRAMPHMRVIRPADATETVEAWRLALERTDGPVGLALSRQKLPVLDRTRARARRAACAAAATSWPTPQRHARRDPDRLGLRGARPAGRARDAGRRRRRRPRGLAARLEPLHGTAAGLPRRGAAAATSGGASRSRPARRSAGRRSSAIAARRSGSIATARPRRRR